MFEENFSDDNNIDYNLPTFITWRKMVTIIYLRTCPTVESDSVSWNCLNRVSAMIMTLIMTYQQLSLVVWKKDNNDWS